MKLTQQQHQRLRVVFKRPIPEFSKPTLWVSVTVIALLGILWIAGGLYLNQQVKKDEERIQQARIEASRREEFLRRGAQYKQDLQQRMAPSGVRNALDGR